MRRGEIVQMGAHRLMCGDATSAQDVARLLDGHDRFLLVSSPPYLKQRTYLGTPFDFDRGMVQVFAALAGFDVYQALVVLGHVHKDGTYQSYWTPWLEGIMPLGWRHHGLYVWDQKRPLPGRFHGRPLPRFEFVFHLARGQASINKTRPNPRAGTAYPKTNFNDGTVARPQDGTGCYQDVRAPDNIFTHSRNADKVDHPAKMPVSLAQDLITAFMRPGTCVLDLFGGSGTTSMAAHALGLPSCTMEIEPAYCDLIIGRHADADRPRAAETVAAVKRMLQRLPEARGQAVGAP